MGHLDDVRNSCELPSGNEVLNPKLEIPKRTAPHTIIKALSLKTIEIDELNPKALNPEGDCSTCWHPTESTRDAEVVKRHIPEARKITDIGAELSMQVGLCRLWRLWRSKYGCILGCILVKHMIEQIVLGWKRVQPAAAKTSSA